MQKVAAAFAAAMAFSTTVIAQTVNKITESRRRKIAEEIAADIRKLEEKYELKADEYAIVVNPAKQELYLVKNREVEKVYPASTSKHGLGTKLDSYRTPWGTHRIKEKIGDGAPLGTIFIYQENTGKVATILKRGQGWTRGAITSRIMWLDGQEPGVNKGKNAKGQVVDTHERYVYIHGMASENRVGRPSSIGCIVMKNDDVIELFDLLPSGTLVEIQKKEYEG